MRVVVPGPQPLVFEQPRRILRAESTEEAVAALKTAEEALAGGSYCAGYLSYELGAAFAIRQVRMDRALPLLVLGIFDQPGTLSPVPSAFRFGPLRPRVTRVKYTHALKRIAHAIYEGEVYQVNYTVPFDFAFEGDPYALFCTLLERSGVSHAAYLEDRNVAIVSLSPELFLSIEDGIVTTKPMKGTAPPGRIEQLESVKNRAEHLMIVDLLRNDLHRVCERVEVVSLYSVERYPTFATMTSTVRGTLRGGVGIGELLEATFPCGSITGAPKRAAMECIGALEPDARGAYTGSIGYFAPDGNANWNVAIRTLQIDRPSNRGRIDIGGGIVADSNPEDEWNEITIKRRFLEPCITPFALLETFTQCDAERGQSVEAHLMRLRRGAQHFGIPFDEQALRTELHAIEFTSPALARVRLDWDGTFTVRTEPLEIPTEPVAVCLAEQRVDSSNPMLQFKTSWRSIQETAFEAARVHGCFDAILRNERGELSDGTRTTVFAEIDGILYTPPLSSGALPGILRESLLMQGRASERVLYEQDLQNCGAVYLGNSARGLLRASIVKELSGV